MFPFLTIPGMLAGENYFRTMWRPTFRNRGKRNYCLSKRRRYAR